MAKIILKTGERTVPEKFESRSEYLIYLRHLFVYEFAMNVIKENFFVLEVGCGEGTKLTQIKAKKRTGVDVSKIAINQAKKKIDHALIANAEKLPFSDKKYDAVMSFFSLEHFERPEKVLIEMIRVLKPGGELVLVAPNFGAPNRSSPCFKGDRVIKLFFGFIKDLIPKSTQNLDWQQVVPLSLSQSHKQDSPENCFLDRR